MDPATLGLISAGIGLVPGLVDIFTPNPPRPVARRPRPGEGWTPPPPGPQSGGYPPLATSLADMALAAIRYGTRTPDASIRPETQDEMRSFLAGRESRRLGRRGAYQLPSRFGR